MSWVYVHSSIYENYFVQWCSIDVWSIGGGGRYLYYGYLCILLYVNLILCSSVAFTYGQLEEGVCQP